MIILACYVTTAVAAPVRSTSAAATAAVQVSSGIASIVKGRLIGGGVVWRCMVLCGGCVRCGLLWSVVVCCGMLWYVVALSVVA